MDGQDTYSSQTLRKFISISYAIQIERSKGSMQDR